jgi:predicted DNA repair protein MutK
VAGTSLIALIDDIASVLDDVALLTKVAAKKTAGVLGDDLALNAQQVSGVAADRELPVVWAVAKGSAKNKLILVPAALAISALAPWAVTPLLMVGGAFLCYEGFEKLAHKLLHGSEEEEHRAEHLKMLIDSDVDPVALEKDKIKGAIRTDFILSAEIIAITLGTVATAAFGTQVAVLAGIAALMTVGVYGLVAGIVKLDDAGLYLSLKAGANAWSRLLRGVGKTILKAAPTMMKSLSIIGTAAMFLVGGGILVHGIPGAESFVHGIAHGAGAASGVGGLAQAIISALLDAVVGIVAGAIVLFTVSQATRGIQAIRANR